MKLRMRQSLPKDATPRAYEGSTAIHQHLFQDVYAWAGQERTYTTGRGSAPFALPENIGAWAEKQFATLRRRRFLQGLSAAAFARGAAETALTRSMLRIHSSKATAGRSVYGCARLRLRGGFQNGLRRFAMTKMQAAVRRARITRPSLS